jgi:hypothetical protein
MDLNRERVNDDPGTYCRDVEAYLCRKNDGHIVRIVGPAFEQVCGWAAKGIPLKVTFRGIDRYFERYYAKGPRRRPVRVEFCEADVLDVFDEWKRAVGVWESAAPPVDGAAGEDAETGGSKRGTLPAHLDRVVARLTARRAGENRPLDSVLEDIVRELDTARAGAKALRGEAREAFVARLRALDAGLVQSAREACDPDTLRRLELEAERELAPFRARMPPDAYAASRRAAIDRLVRDHASLPTITYDS